MQNHIAFCTVALYLAGVGGNLCFVCLERVIGLLSSYFQSVLNHIWKEEMSTESIIEYVKKCSIICGLRKADEND